MSSDAIWPNDECYIVVCTDCESEDSQPYYLATRRVFVTRAEAEKYAATVAQSRTPLVIAGRFASLRFEDKP